MVLQSVLYAVLTLRYLPKSLTAGGRLSESTFCSAHGQLQASCPGLQRGPLSPLLIIYINVFSFLDDYRRPREARVLPQQSGQRFPRSLPRPEGGRGATLSVSAVCLAVKHTLLGSGIYRGIGNGSSPVVSPEYFVGRCERERLVWAGLMSLAALHRRLLIVQKEGGRRKEGH